MSVEASDLKGKQVNKTGIIACSGNPVHSSKSDILKIPLLGRLIKSSVFLFVLRCVVLFLFAYSIWFGLVEPDPEKNYVTTGFFWALFWPFFMIFSLVTLGPVICTICPHAFIGKYLTRWGLNKPVPKKLRNPFIGLAILLLGYWGAYYAFAPFGSPWFSALFFLLLSVLAIVSYLVFDKMAYCKYFCPMGPVKNAFGKMGFTWLSTYPDACVGCKTFDCAKACDHHLSPFNFDKGGSMDGCTLCMDCTQACPAVSWRLVKPSYSLLNPIKRTRNVDVWTYILLLAVISITMRFHHALGRSAIADQFPWSRNAHWLETQFPALAQAGLDTTGLVALVYALVLTIGVCVGGFAIGRRILQIPYDKAFSTLGYALAPLMIIGGLGHASEFFFLHYYSDIANAANQLLNLQAEIVEPLARRGEPWLHKFVVFQYIAVTWSMYLFYKRLQLIDASTRQKWLAFPFVSAMPIVYLALIMFSAYVFATYGVAMTHGH